MPALEAWDAIRCSRLGVGVTAMNFPPYQPVFPDGLNRQVSQRNRLIHLLKAKITDGPRGDLAANEFGRNKRPYLINHPIFESSSGEGAATFPQHRRAAQLVEVPGHRCRREGC